MVKPPNLIIKFKRHDENWRAVVVLDVETWEGKREFELTGPLKYV